MINVIKNYKKKIKKNYKKDFKKDFNEKKNILIINKYDYCDNIKYNKKNYLNKNLFYYNYEKSKYLKFMYKNKFFKKNIISIIFISLLKKNIICQIIIFLIENIDSREIYKIVLILINDEKINN